MAKERRNIHNLLIAFTGVLLLLFFDYLGLFSGINSFLLDLSFRIRGPRPTDSRIIIAAVDAKTLGELGRWPIRRIHYAELLDHTREAAVVGFDIVMAEPTADDALLAAAIHRHGRVVLPVYTDGAAVYDPSGDLIAAGTGHVHVELGMNGIVREIFHSLYLDNRLLPSMASVLYEAATGRRYDRRPLAPEAGDYAGKIVQADRMGINYYGAPRSFAYISFLDIIAGRYPPDFFQGKVVLVGVTAAGLPDKMLTPFSGQRNRMPAVELQATVLNNLLDGNDTREIPPWALGLLAVTLFGICFVLPLKLADRRVLFVWLSSLLLVTLAAFAALSLLNLWARPALLYSSATLACALSHLFRLDDLARKLDCEYAAIASRLGGAPVPAGKLKPSAGLPGAVSADGISVKIEMLVRVVDEFLKSNQALEAETSERLRTMAELRQKDQMLIQQSRMAAMGEMLNNIAHQWRQPLNVLGLTLQQLGLFWESGQLNKELFDSKLAKAMEILLHLSQTIDDFRNFSAPDKEKSRFRVDLVVVKTVSLVEESFRAQKIAIAVEAIGEPQIDGYPNEFGQVLLNILMNARDALVERGRSGAQIRVRSWAEGGRTTVTVTDNAGGIKEDIIDRIFDAYFTTKELGKGTGVGLFMSKSIIEKNMGGRLTARNTGDGAEFRIEIADERA